MDRSLMSIAPLCRGGYGSQLWICIIARRRIGKFRSEKERRGNKPGDGDGDDDDDFLATPTPSYW